MNDQDDVVGQPMPAEPQPPQPHEWLTVGPIQDAISGRIGVVQICSCGTARTIDAPWERIAAAPVVRPDARKASL